MRKFNVFMFDQNLNYWNSKIDNSCGDNSATVQCSTDNKKKRESIDEE